MKAVLEVQNPLIPFKAFDIRNIYHKDWN